jgi:hypothetical protein
MILRVDENLQSGARHMQQHFGRLSTVLFFGFSAVALAQTPPAQAPVTKYDGTYAFVSSAKVNETYTTMRTEHPGRCPHLAPRTALTITNGRVQFNEQVGTVGPHGELSTRLATLRPSGRAAGAFPPAELPTHGQIDENGRIRARRLNWSCSYDLIWQKMSK